jgi:hypothetical protein
MRVSNEADSSIYRKVLQPKNLKSEWGSHIDPIRTDEVRLGGASQVDPIRTDEVRSEGITQMGEVDQNVGLTVITLENWSTHTIRHCLVSPIN